MKPWHASSRGLLGILLLGAAVAFWSGCEEDDGGGGLGDGHDFGDNNPNLVYCVGDSITEGNASPGATPYPSLLGPKIGKTVMNAGDGGSMSGHGKNITPGILSGRKPGFLIIFYGAVDAIFDRDQAETIDHLRSMIQMCKNNKTIPIVATLTPQIREHRVFNSWVNRINPKIRELAGQEGAALVDVNASFQPPESYLLDDGLHPNASGMELLATLFAEAF